MAPHSAAPAAEASPNPLDGLETLCAAATIMGEAGKQATLSPVPIFPAGGFTKTGKPQLKPLATEVRVRGLDGRGALTLTVAALREGSKVRTPLHLPAVL